MPQLHTPERKPLLDPSDARGVVGHDDDYPELVTRWYEYATFTPTMRAHGSRSDTEVWSYGKEAETVISKYLRLRYTLIPYIYSLGKHTYDTGAPFMRALFMDFPNDANVAKKELVKFGQAAIDADSNLVSIPRLKHWLVTAWYNSKYPGDPEGRLRRDVISEKSFDEQREIGLEQLRAVGVLK